MNSTALPFWIAGAVVLAGLYGGWKLWQVETHDQVRAAGTIEFSPSESERVADFELTRSTGEPFRSRDMLGEVWVTSFFFTTCPGSCTKLNTNIRMLQTDASLDGVKWVSISVDPVTDTLEALERYADDFGADPNRWYFLRGKMREVRHIGQKLFKLPVEYQGHKDYGVVIDRAGEVRGIFNINSHRERERMKEVLVELLAEAPPEAAPGDRAPRSSLPGLPPEPVGDSKTVAGKPSA